MNDLNGLDWSGKPGTGQKQTAQGNYNAFSALKPTPPVSGRASPAVGGAAQSAPPKAATPAASNDSFSNLVAFGGNNANKNLSLQEQQKRLAESKLQQLVGQKKQLQDQWAGNDEVWNSLGSGRSTPAVQTSNGTSSVPLGAQEQDDDLFAAFNKPASTPNKATPPPMRQLSPDPDGGDDDDDPFGLSDFQAKQKTRPLASQADDQTSFNDDDILGDLGKPVSAKAPSPASLPPRKPSPEPVLISNHPQDKAVAELVDMGFPADKAKRALESTDTGMNVQAAVGLLLRQAHEEARQKSRGREEPQSPDLGSQASRRTRPAQVDYEQERRANSNPRERSSTPSGDPTKAAQEFGAAFMKSAGSFWKTAQKTVQQAVSEFNSDSESGSNQPKWMQEAAAPSRPRQEDQRSGRPRPEPAEQVSGATDEAMMLETQRPAAPPRPQRSRPDRQFDSSADTSRDHSPAMPSRLRESHAPRPGFMQQQQDPLANMMRPRTQPPPARTSLNKQAAEDQASQAYTSSARRRKPATPAPAQDEGDLMEGSSQSANPSSQPIPARPQRSAPPTTKPKPATTVTPIQKRPPPPSRTIPTISPISLKASHAARTAGNTHFKRGDYSAAHEAYTTSLTHIPATHPLRIILLTNRALTALKTGQPKQTIIDADAAITLIGPSKGESETVDLLDPSESSAPKPMREYYGKALMRKAEALENLEKWTEAAAIWRLCVEDGHGGATAIQGRARAEKAAAPKPTAPVRKPASRPPPSRSAPPTISKSSQVAVSALRAQNAAAEKLDDEKFALADSVAERVGGWKNGKEDNLRALLGSLDTVLWDGSGWKKVSMAELVLPNKVKVVYMKGIGKCHPDKIPTDATTEQRMIAGAVFSTLNEAWDKFRTENGM